MSAGTGVCGVSWTKSPEVAKGGSGFVVLFHVCSLLLLTDSVVAALAGVPEVMSRSKEESRCSRRDQGQWRISRT